MEEIIFLLPQQDRPWFVIGIAAIVLLLAGAGLIQWRRAKKLSSLRDQYPQIHRRLMWLDWPCPIAFLTLLLLLAMARGLDRPLTILMAIVGFAVGCFLDVVAAKPLWQSRWLAKNTNKGATGEAS